MIPIYLGKYYPLKHPETITSAVSLLSHLQSGTTENLENISRVIICGEEDDDKCYKKPKDPKEDWDFFKHLKSPFGYSVQLELGNNGKFYLRFSRGERPEVIAFLNEVWGKKSSTSESMDQKMETKCFNSMKYYPSQQPETTENVASLLHHLQNGLKENIENISGVMLEDEKGLSRFFEKPEDPKADWTLFKHLKMLSGYDVHIKVYEGGHYLHFHQISESHKLIKPLE